MREIAIASWKGRTKTLAQQLWSWLAQRWAELRPYRPQRQLRVVETLALGDRRQLLIVECERKRLLIGFCGNFLARLAELPDAEERG